MDNKPVFFVQANWPIFFTLFSVSNPTALIDAPIFTPSILVMFSELNKLIFLLTSKSNWVPA